MPTATKKSVKKTAAPKTQKKADSPAWNTIHIFGYGESQVIGKDRNGKVLNDSLKSLAPLLSHLADKQQKGTKINAGDLHALNIFNGAFIDFLPRPGKNKHQRIAWNDLDSKTIKAFADEIISKTPEGSSGEAVKASNRKRAFDIANLHAKKA